VVVPVAGDLGSGGGGETVRFKGPILVGSKSGRGGGTKPPGGNAVKIFPLIGMRKGAGGTAKKIWRLFYGLVGGLGETSLWFRSNGAVICQVEYAGLWGGKCGVGGPTFTPRKKKPQGQGLSRPSMGGGSLGSWGKIAPPLQGQKGRGEREERGGETPGFFTNRFVPNAGTNALGGETHKRISQGRSPGR